MLPSLRSALLICATLGAISFAPARAEPNDGSLNPVTVASLPEVPVPDLLDPDGEPQLSGPGAQEIVAPEADEPSVAQTKPTGDLSDLVAAYRTADAGSHELECLATGVYFEAKSESLSGQLAVGQVIATAPNRVGAFLRLIAACCSSAASSRSFAVTRCHRSRIRPNNGKPRSRSPRSSTRI